MDAALASARQRGQRADEATARYWLGEIAARRDPPELERATEHYGHALALATELGMRPLVAHCHAGLAVLFRRCGKPQEAEEHVLTATALYREMEMTYWLERLERETASP